ncbi:tRNA (adenine(37)-N6)-methyltransferase [Larimichthys crocea]|uniref:Uncharacterized protein n=1 Tax=Larimichthys crocea TaxID=215358 RepID=A0ACD3RUW4_LARCR|nr:tRNA (adenine(37)-N6)-methyltransferase [Larimichthys crocea]
MGPPDSPPFVAPRGQNCASSRVSSITLSTLWWAWSITPMSGSSFSFTKTGHLSYKAKVKPPRLNGQKVGVYSTRSPHRPNALGLTLAKLDRIVGDTIHLSSIDMIAGTPVLDIKPYIPEYDSPHTRMGMDSQPYDSNTDQPTASLDETTDTLNIREDADAQSDLECEKPDDFGSKECEADVPVTDSAKVCAQFSLHKALEGVKAYVTHDDLRQVSCEGKDQVSDSPKIKPPELTAEHPCYGEEAYSTIAGWIREPPVGSLEVRFTPHAERELAEFLPTHLSGPSESKRPRFKFLRSPEEAAAAIRGVLSADPRSVYRRTRCKDKLFFFTLDTADVTCWFGRGFAEVLQPSSRCGERTPLRSLDNEMLHLSTPSSRFKSKSLLSADVKTTKGDVPLCAPECHLQSPPSTNMIQTNASSIDVAACGLGDVTFKSLICAGGEVEIAGSSMCAEESIILPKDQAVQNTCQAEDTVISDSMIVQSCAQLDKALQDNSLNSTNLSVCGQPCQEEHADHPYCSGGAGVHVIATFSETTNGFKEPANAPSEITFKSFNCTGGEVQISDGTRLADETVPLPADQTAACSESFSYGTDPSMLANDQNVQKCDDRFDHPYCNIESFPSNLSGNIAITQEPIPFSLDGMDEVKQISLVVPDSQTGRQESITFSSLISARVDVEVSDDTQMSQKTSALPDNHAVMCQSLDDTSVPTSVTQDHIQDHSEQPDSRGDNDEVVDTDSPTVSTSSLADKSVNSQMHETSKKDSVHPEDSALPSALHRSESALSAETPTPVDVHLEHVSQVHNGSGPPESSEAKDSALGSSGNVPVLCNSAEKPNANHLPDVLKVLSECHSVASALQIGLLSPCC